MKTFPGIMPVYSNSKTSNEQNVVSVGEHRTICMLSKSVLCHTPICIILTVVFSVQPGVRVTVHLKDVPAEAANTPHVVLFSLLQHEHKVTVLNFTVQRNTEYDGSVRSKVSSTFY